MKNHWLKYGQFWATVEHEDGMQTRCRRIIRRCKERQFSEITWDVSDRLPSMGASALDPRYSWYWQLEHISPVRKPKCLKVFNGHTKLVYTLNDLSTIADWSRIKYMKFILPYTFGTI